jgi:L-rhamnose mutarotase
MTPISQQRHERQKKHHQSVTSCKALATHTGVRTLSAYLEFNTNDLYLVSYVLNAGSLRIGEVVKAGIGVRLGF